ncbi:putative N-acetyltransferase YoaP [Gottschalkia purinilytica]|uniref:Putative N-acetyltransferase YoaP n=1 Tax=Gottschalkia purinilytica TaxID=1503 RepID=A0A0L0WBX7_GOTPU|nr:N-acetyltransferase [Gottschalkia purinilytica]KNF08976.1 putative N-acetyltransferase YoaP [Gottschalkia purinilytica]
MNFITLTTENIDKEHICCAISDRKCKNGYESKKSWLKEEIEKGYVFTKLNERAKVFIEYCPSEIAYLPVDAVNYMVINCFWVSGRYSKKGYGKELLNRCITDSKSKGKNGIIVLSSNKKRPYLSDKNFFIKNGFLVADTAEPYFELLYLRFNDDTDIPKFLPNVKNGICDDNGGFKVYYSDTCPFNDYYINTVQSQIALEKGFTYETIKLDSREKAIDSPCACTNYSLFYRGKFITHELNPKKFQKIIDEL